MGRSTAATKMLASRARHRVREATPVPEQDLARQRKVVGAFLAAARDGDFNALLTVLDPDVVVRADSAVVPASAPTRLRGAHAVAKQALLFSRRTRSARLALLNGSVGIVAPAERHTIAMSFTIAHGKIREIEVRAG